jgi:hypothetical protein
MTFILNDSIKYVATSGGLRIDKHQDGEIVETFIRRNRVEFSEITDIPEDSERSWSAELIWLCEEHSDIVGKNYIGWDKGFVNREGELNGVGTHRGQGVNNPTDKIAVNRLGIPANITENWDWERLTEFPDEGIQFKKNKKTGKIIKCDFNDMMIPCDVYPEIFGPYESSEEEIEEYKNNG